MVSPRERWQLNREEPTGLKLFKAIPEIRDIFIRGEWFDFICSFNGHHTGISLIFAQNFDGFQTKIGDITIHITSTSSLEHALSLSVVRGGLKRGNYQLKCAISFWWKNIKTPIGARESQSFG
jgi:hypothetical protein